MVSRALRLNECVGKGLFRFWALVCELIAKTAKAAATAAVI